MLAAAAQLGSADACGTAGAACPRAAGVRAALGSCAQARRRQLWPGWERMRSACPRLHASTLAWPAADAACLTALAALLLACTATDVPLHQTRHYLAGRWGGALECRSSGAESHQRDCFFCSSDRLLCPFLPYMISLRALASAAPPQPDCDAAACSSPVPLLAVACGSLAPLTLQAEAPERLLGRL